MIPTFNRWKRLRRSLDGALAQTDVSLEVVLVDDASDEPASTGLTLHDPRVRLLRNPTRGGVAQARNRGIAESRGNWIAFLDDDDLWSPDKLTRQLQLGAETRADLVYSSAVIVDSSLQVVSFLAAPSPRELRRRIRFENAIPAGQSNVLVRRKVVLDLGGFDEHLSMLADWELWIRLASVTDMASCEAVHVAYVLHDSNMSAHNLDSLSEFEYVADLHLPNPAARRKVQVNRARWRAYRHRMAGRRRLAAREYLRAAVAYRSAAARVGAALVGERIRSKARGRSQDLALPWLKSYRESLPQG